MASTKVSKTSVSGHVLGGEPHPLEKGHNMGGVVTANMAMDWSDLKLDKNVDERLVVDCWGHHRLN